MKFVSLLILLGSIAADGYHLVKREIQTVHLRLAVVSDNVDYANFAIGSLYFWAKSQLYLQHGILFNITIITSYLDTNETPYANIRSVCQYYYDVAPKNVNLIVLIKNVTKHDGPQIGLAFQSGCIWASPESSCIGATLAHEIGHMLGMWPHQEPVFESNLNCRLQSSESFLALMNPFAFGAPHPPPEKFKLLTCGRIPTVPNRFSRSEMTNFGHDMLNLSVSNITNFLTSHLALLTRLQHLSTTYSLSDNEYCVHGHIINKNIVCIYGQYIVIDKILHPKHIECSEFLFLQNTSRAVEVASYARRCSPYTYKLDYEPDFVFSEHYVYPIKKNNDNSYSGNWQHGKLPETCSTSLDSCEITCRQQNIQCGTAHFPNCSQSFVTVLESGSACALDLGVCIDSRCDIVHKPKYGTPKFFSEVSADFLIQEKMLDKITFMEFKAVGFVNQALETIYKFDVPYYSRLTKLADYKWQLRMGGVRFLIDLCHVRFGEKCIFEVANIHLLEKPWSLVKDGQQCFIEEFPLFSCRVGDWYFS